MENQIIEILETDWSNDIKAKDLMQLFNKRLISMAKDEMDIVKLSNGKLIETE